MSTKVRVYEVARDLGIDNKALVALFQSVGVPEVKNHMSAVGPEAVERVKRHLEKQPTQKVVEERIRPTVVKRRAVSRGAPPRSASEPTSERVQTRSVRCGPRCARTANRAGAGASASPSAATATAGACDGPAGGGSSAGPERRACRAGCRAARGSGPGGSASSAGAAAGARALSTCPAGATSSGGRIGARCCRVRPRRARGAARARRGPGARGCSLGAHGRPRTASCRVAAACRAHRCAGARTHGRARAAVSTAAGGRAIPAPTYRD
jgi:hypothetical protein